MAMFGTSGRETYDALYPVLNQPADVSALEREQAPGAFEGDMLGAVGTGVYRGLSRGAALAADAFTPVLRPVAKTIDEMFGSKTDEWLLGEQEKTRRALVESKLDPKTNGTAAQVLYGLGDVLTTVLSTRGSAPAAGIVYGYGQYQIGRAEGLDTATALGKATIEGGSMGVSVALPAAMAGSLAFRAASGAALNVGVGIPERLAVSTLLRARGYEEMARQYDPLDSTAILTEIVLGATFGGLLGPRARAAKLPPPERIPPSTVDAALTANQQRHAEIHTAPGIPTDTRTRQAHTQALDSAVESLVMGREVNVEGLLQEAGFLGKRPDFDALRVIADELEKAGAADLVAQVRALEAEARARGLVVDEDTLGSVVLSDKPVQTTVAGVAERDATPIRIGGDQVPAKLVLVEAGDVQATMTKADNQFRDRTRVASEQQIADIAARLDPGLLGDAPVMDYGAPVLAADGTVIGGNGRAAAVARAYEQGTAEAYRAALREQFGDAVDGMQQPMLVRVLQREVDVQKAAILSNEGGGLRMSALEQAKVDAERLGDLRGVEFNDDGMADITTIRQWVGNMPQNQRAAIMDADGRLSAEGATRLRNAVLYKAYGDSPTLARLVESTDPGSRNIAAALTRAAPAVADAREAIERGDLYPLGLHDDLIAAVEKLDALRRDGLAVDDWVKQIDAFGDGMTAEARLLVQFLDRNIRSSRAISDGVFGFYNRLLEVGDPKQGSMFEASDPDKMRMLTLALEGEAPMYSRSAYDAQFPVAGEMVDGRVVRDEIPNRSSIAASVENYTILLGVREVPISAFDQEYVGGISREKLDARTARLADEIAASGEINPLIVGVDKDGLYIIEGGHRFDALIASGAKSLPALVVIEGSAPQMSRGAVRTPETVETLTAAFRAMFGRDADRLLETGRVRIVQSVSDLPGSGHPADVGGMFWKGEAWIVADNTGLSQIRGRALHEVGEHAGMQQMLGDALYQQVLDTVARKAETDPMFAEARALAEARANRPEHVPAETLAYLVENAPELPIVRRVLAAVRQWLYRVTGGRFVDLTQADLQMMAAASLRRYAREAEVQARGEDVPWYMTLFHGSPTAFKPEPGAPLGALRWRFINTGEGAQAFGYGHYLAQQEWIARTRYRDRLVKRKASEARLEIPDGKGGTIEITQRDDPAWRIGDRIVHEKLGAESRALADAAAQVSRFGYEQARKTFEIIVQMSRNELGRQEADVEGKLALLAGDNAEAARAMVIRGLNYQRDLVALNEATLRAVDEVTVPGEVRKGRGQYGEQIGFMQARATVENWADGTWIFINESGSRVFQTRDEAVAFAEAQNRVLRPDIQEVRPEPPKGALYGKFIPDETWNQMMIWDAPMSAQPEAVQAAFAKFGIAGGAPKWDGMRTKDRAYHIEKVYSSLGDRFKFRLYQGYDRVGDYDSVDAAKEAAAKVATDFEGEKAYRRLVEMVSEESGDGPLADLLVTADSEIRNRRVSEGMDPAELDYEARPDEVASVILNLLGVPGHRFLDGETRAKGWQDPEARFNVVLYSDDLGRVAWEARKGDTEWVTANGNGRVVREGDGFLAYANDEALTTKIGSGWSYVFNTIEEATRAVEQALDGQLYSRTGDGDRIPAPDPLEDTTLPDARRLSEQADAEIATATELSQGFLPAAECALRVGA